MFYEFEGQTETEAVQNAMKALNIKNFDYEIISESKRGLFKKSSVKIRVILKEAQNSNDDIFSVNDKHIDDDLDEVIVKVKEGDKLSEAEESVIDFIDTLIEKMGYDGKAELVARGSTGKDYFNIRTSVDSAMLIGYRGERLDALQILSNSFIAKSSGDDNFRVVLDVDGYRETHKDRMISDALEIAKKVKASGKSYLLDPLNSYERRLVHRAISQIEGLGTESQGNGLLKRIKIFKIN